MSPQHLQQQDLYHERMVNARFDAISAYNWGVRSLIIDPGALGKGELVVQSFSGVFPDGLFIRFDQGDRLAPAARTVEPHFPSTRTEPIDVYLGIMMEREGVSSFLETPAGSSSGLPRSRFAMANRVVKDLAGDGASATISFGVPSLTILFGNEPRDDYSCFKIAEISRDGSGSYVLVETYIPPSLCIEASPFIMKGLQRIVGFMTGKQKDLSELRRQRDASTVEFTAADVTSFLQLSALNGVLPIMNHAGKAGDLSPQQLYLLIAQTTGQLATFSSTVTPNDIPGFNHLDLRGTFEELFALLTGLLRSAIRKEYVEVALEEKRGVRFGRFDEETFKKCKQFILAVKSDSATEEQVATRLAALSKIASWADIQGVLSSATPGVPLKVTHRPPPEIPIRAGVVYFTLDTTVAHWKGIKDGQNIAIYLPPPFDPASSKVELMGIPEKA